jgi:GcrA cell cycle regulator
MKSITLTDEVAEKIKKMWELGSEPGQIVRYFGGRLTRGQVAGKLHRMGLSRKKIKPRGEAKMVVRHKYRQKPKAELRTPVVTQFGMQWEKSAVMPPPSNAAKRSFNTVSGPAYSVAELDGSVCHWPLGDPLQEGFCFCAAPRWGKGPYCWPHYRVAFHVVRT